MERPMASTTTLKLPDVLKARINELAEASGRSPHAFMIEALQAHTEAVERRRDFVRAALAAEEDVAEYGLVYSTDEVHRYLEAKLTGKSPRKPRPSRR